MIACAQNEAFVTNAKQSSFSANKGPVVLKTRVKSSRIVPKAHQVTIEHEGTTTVLEVPEYTSILDAALDAGIDLPHDCKLGVCLTCPSKVVSGEVDQSDGTLEDSVTAQGYALTCMTFPRSDCTIMSITEDELVDAQFSGRS
uniref:Ferredoxin n=1 Tax=Heterosigma akashiwo TaxID=2829 RepID=A0A7S3UW21_HETAK